MKCFKKIILLLFVCFALKAQALSILKIAEKPLNRELVYTSYGDYFPFGYLGKDSRGNRALMSVIKDAYLELFPEEKDIDSFKYYPTISEAMFDMTDGKVNVYIGAFYSTSDFNDLDFVFPAILNNPIHLMMVPSKISKVKQVDDLKSLKGIYASNEHFSDYMLKTFSDLNMKGVKDVDEAYESLMTGEADYILGSYYYHYAQIVERGLKSHIAFSSKPLWNMPMFIAISKNINDRKAIHDYFRGLVSTDAFKNKILEKIKQALEQKEQESIGVVPPMYVRQGKAGELTPADELIKEGGN